MLSVDECWIDEILEAQRIGAHVFLPFIIARLQGETEQTEAFIDVVLHNVGNEIEQQHRLRLRWHPENRPLLQMAVQERVITEWSACGLACCLLAFYTDFRLSQVAAEGDRFDYWVSNGQSEIGLEISGTLSGNAADLEARHRLKRHQLLDNPHGVDGFAIVVGFSLNQALVSFHRFGEVSS